MTCWQVLSSFALLPLWISTLAKADAPRDAQKQQYQPLLGLPNFSEANHPNPVNPPVTAKETVMSADNQPNPTPTTQAPATATTTTAPATPAVVADPAVVAEKRSVKKRVAEMERLKPKVTPKP